MGHARPESTANDTVRPGSGPGPRPHIGHNSDAVIPEAYAVSGLANVSSGANQRNRLKVGDTHVAVSCFSLAHPTNRLSRIMRDLLKAWLRP